MMQHFHPVAAAMAANHCQELSGRRTTRSGMLALLATLGERFAASLEQDLAGFCNTARPQIRSSGVETISERDLAERIGTLAANGLWAIASGQHRLLVSLEAIAVLAQLDRAFGGSGEVDSKALPEEFPMSGELLATEFEQFITGRFMEVLPSACELRNIGRNSHYALLGSFPADCELAVLSLEISQSEAQPWVLRLACPVEGLADLLDRRRSAKRNAVRRAPASPLDRPFADMPLSVEARLVDMNVKLSALSQLEPGKVIPVAVARTVPLRIGQSIIARGTLGELDDRQAIQITQTTILPESN